MNRTVAFTVAVAVAAQALAQDYSIPWSTIDSGGGALAAGDYALVGTIGQPDAHRPLTAGAYTLTGGFHAAPPTPPCRADFNGDGNLDPDDLSDYITCFFTQAAFPGACPQADFNTDGNIDPDDLSDYITAFFAGCG